MSAPINVPFTHHMIRSSLVCMHDGTGQADVLPLSIPLLYTPFPVPAFPSLALLPISVPHI